MASIVLTILSLLVLIIFIGSLYAFFYSITQFVFSAGDSEKIKKAWNSIRYMILGIVLTLVVLFLFPIILKEAKVPGYDYYSANNIFAQVSKITVGLLNLGKQAAIEYQEDRQANQNSDTTDTNDSTIANEPIDYSDLEL